MTDLQTLDKTYIANTYARFPVEVVSGHGSILTDRDGKDYIDMGSGIGVTAFGIHLAIHAVERDDAELAQLVVPGFGGDHWASG